MIIIIVNVCQRNRSDPFADFARPRAIFLLTISTRGRAYSAIDKGG